MTLAAEIAVSPVLTWLVEHGWQVLVVFVLPAIKRWFDARSTGAELENVTKAFWEAALSAVAVVDRELKPKLLAALADGVLTEVEKRDLQAAAIEIVRNSIGPTLWAQAQKHLGPTIETWVKGLIERALSVHKAGAEARASVVTLQPANAYLSQALGGATP